MLHIVTFILRQNQIMISAFVMRGHFITETTSANYHLDGIACVPIDGIFSKFGFFFDVK